MQIVPKFLSSLLNVESADDNLFRSLRRSGCYRVSFGFQSGYDRVLKEFGHNIDTLHKAVLYLEKQNANEKNL